MITVASPNRPICITEGLYTFESAKFVSDDYHTMEELYDHRRELSRVLFESLKPYYHIFKSKVHADGTMFPGYFVVMALLPEGQISYHYDLKYWDDFDLSEREQSEMPKYDGHTSQDVLQRLKDF